MANCPQGMYELNGMCYPNTSMYQDGGLLTGPSHEQGGISARLQNGGQVELEGGEYIINSQTTDAVGTEFLDQLNSTSTTYHQGGFQQGKLPSPSKYKRGGKINRRRKMQMGGSTNQCPPGQYMQNGQCVQSGGGTSMGGRTSMGGGYQRGGRVNRNQNPIRRKFIARENIYQYETNVPVPVGTPLHQHKDGTIMTQYSMNSNNVAVTRIQGSPGTLSWTNGGDNIGIDEIRKGGKINRKMRKGGKINRKMKKGGKINRKKMQEGGQIPVNTGTFNPLLVQASPETREITSRNNSLKLRIKRQNKRIRSQKNKNLVHSNIRTQEVSRGLQNQQLLKQRKTKNRKSRSTLNRNVRPVSTSNSLRGVTSTGISIRSTTPGATVNTGPPLD